MEILRIVLWWLMVSLPLAMSGCPFGLPQLSNGVCDISSVCPNWQGIDLQNGHCFNCTAGLSYFSDDGLCHSCDQALPQLTCATCAWSWTHGAICTGCPDGYKLVGGRCYYMGCAAGYAPSSDSTTNCVPCGALFGNCTQCGPTQCTACNAGYVLAGSQGLCLPCNAPALNLGNCDSCLQVGVTTYACTACHPDQILNPATLGCGASCPSGYYLNGTSCLSCPSGCNSCDNTGYCVACNAGLLPYLGGCISQCPTDAYVSGGVCYPCSRWGSHCAGCSAVGCSVCEYGGVLQQGNCTDCQSIWGPSCGGCTLSDCFGCANGYELRGTPPLPCVPCAINWGSSCAQCDSLICTACQPHYGYDDGSGTCLPCADNCLNCPGTICTECLPGYFPLPDQSCNTCGLNNNPACTNCTSMGCAACRTGYFQNAPYGPCLTCDQLVPDCAQCTSTVCSLCQPGYNLYNGTCVAQCPDGLFSPTQPGTACQSCTQLGPNCVTCTAAACLSCLPNISILQNGRCPFCGVMPNCFHCNAAGCTACAGGDYILYQGVCHGLGYTCPAGTYSSNTVEQGQHCDSCADFGIACTACASSGCTQCLPGNYLQGGTCHSCAQFDPECAVCSPQNCTSCTQGKYVDAAGRCRQCSDIYGPNCLDCTVANCTTCMPGFYLYEGSCQPIATAIDPYCASRTEPGRCDACKNEAYYYMTPSGICDACTTFSSTCVACNSTAHCTQCAFLTYATAGICAFQNECPTNTIPQQGVCVPDGTFPCHDVATCQTCAPNGLACAVCISPTTLRTSDGRCALCGEIFGGCEQCNATQCTVCSSVAPIQYPLGLGCVKSCPPGTYQTSMGGTPVCQSCTHWGASCQACNSTQCLVCEPGFALSPSGVCMACGPDCLLCNTTNCLLCGVGAIFGTGCSQTQPPSTWTSRVNARQYVPCSTGCRGCDSNGCLDCSAGYYLYQGSCRPCGAHCDNCTSANCALCASGYYAYQGACLPIATAIDPLCVARSNPVVCSTCAPGAYVTGPGTCALCTDIDPSCVACDPNNLCTQCTNGLAAAYGACSNICPSGTEASSGTCVSCGSACPVNGPCGVYGCICDTSNQACAACSLPTQVLIGGECIDCGSLFKGCAQCTADQCLACPFELPNYYPDLAACLAACPTGTYEVYANGLTTCVDCTATYSQSCMACDASECTTCLPNTRLDNSQPDPCVPCVFPCMECTAQECLRCASYLFNGTCHDVCPQGTYSILANGPECVLCPTDGSPCPPCLPPYHTNNQTGICAACDPLCLECDAADPTWCSHCNDGLFLTNNGECVSCPPGCISCEDKCLGCIDGYYSWEGTCLLTCPITTGPLNGSCTPCISPGCLECGYGPDICTQCQSGDMPILYTYPTGAVAVGCVGACPVHYYAEDPNTQVCVPCAPGCSGCLSVNGIGLPPVIGPASAPFIGTFDEYMSLFSPNLTVCIPCIDATSLTVFHECVASYSAAPPVKRVIGVPEDPIVLSGETALYFQNQLFGTYTLLSALRDAYTVFCPPGSYATPPSVICQSCPLGCVDCTDAITCLACEPPWALFDGVCTSECPIGYMLIDGVCQSCPDFCNECDSTGCVGMLSPSPTSQCDYDAASVKDAACGCGMQPCERVLSV